MSPLAVNVRLPGSRSKICLPRVMSYRPCSKKQKQDCSCECCGSLRSGGYLTSVSLMPASSRTRRRLAWEKPLQQDDSALRSVRGRDVLVKMPSSHLQDASFVRL